MNAGRFCVGQFSGDYWIGGFEDFIGWLSSEQRKCIPRGPCGQDVMTTSGVRGLMGKYPTFFAAYHAWETEVTQHSAETK